MRYIAFLLLILSYPTLATTSTYDRSTFGIWKTINCVNTRNAIFRDTSTVAVVWDTKGCQVVAGRWYDPYGDKIYTKTDGLEIDHMVPPGWAWTHGAQTWPKEKKVQFGNDPENLNVVVRKLNRSKNDSSPDKWLPPNIAYQCQYVRRFDYIKTKYKLRYKNGEAIWMKNKLKECK